LSLLPAILRAKINKVPVILWGHGYSKRENVIRKYLRQQAAELVSALIFYDFQTASAYIKSGFCKNKIFVAPNSIDQSDIKYAKSYWKNHKDKLTLFQDQLNIIPSKTIVYIGRIYSENRLDILIKALALIKKEHSDVKLIIIGKGLNEEEYLRELSHSLGVSDHIIWVGALYEELEIAKWMISATVFCYPENIGLSIIHAFGYGLPVVTSDYILGHNPEIYAFKEQINGLFFKSDSSQNLADTIKYIFNNPDQSSLLSKMALKTIDENFNIPKMVSGFRSAIESVYYEI
jgi:glycosyltransferase involved in cell wall biosynthesis